MKTSGTDLLNNIRQRLYGSVGWQFDAPGNTPEVLSNFRKWRMISTKSGSFLQNGTLTGVGFGAQAFRIVDLEASSLPGRDATVNSGFSGAIISFHQTDSFEGRTIIAEDKGVFNPTTIDLMQRVPFECPDFEHIYEVYSDCDNEARNAITSGLVKKLTKFNEVTYGQNAQCVLHGKHIHFLLDLDGGFQFSKDLSQLSFEALKKAVIAEAGNICVLFEKLYRIQACIGGADTVEAGRERLAHYKKLLLTMIEASKSLEEPEQSSASETDLSEPNITVESSHDPVRRKAS